MRQLPLALFLSMSGLLACGSDILVSEKAQCDGEKQAGEETVDQPFDLDGDGFFDGANPGCAAIYPATLLDCNDGDPSVNPGAAELGCNGIDDDCDEASADEEDADADGVSSCEDCADNDPTRKPGAAEVGCNSVDDDCDDATPDFADNDLDGATSCVDCDDNNAAIRPGATEIGCNDVDDDCNAATPDAVDADFDGVACGDCDDGDNTIFPGADEVCDNGLDENCNGEVDESCDVSYTDLWVLDASVRYSCAWGFVNVNFNKLNVFDARPDITIASATGSQPGSMTGSFTGADTFSVSNTLTGSCDEHYSITGSFPTETTIEGTLDISFTGSCYDCTTQSFSFTGSR